MVSSAVDGLAGQGAAHEHDAAAVLAGDGLTTGREAIGAERDDGHPHEATGVHRRSSGPEAVPSAAMARPIQIAPSVLPADFARLGEEVAALEKAGVDLVQWDVMDGQFVPNLTFGPDVIAAARSWADVPFEAHLMVLTPDVLAPRYVEAGLPPPHRPRRGVPPPAPHARARSGSSGRPPASPSTRPPRPVPSPTSSTSSSSCW